MYIHKKYIESMQYNLKDNNDKITNLLKLLEADNFTDNQYFEKLNEELITEEKEIKNLKIIKSLYSKLKEINETNDYLIKINIIKIERHLQRQA